MEEQVLCIRRALFDEIGAFQGVRTEVAAYIPRILEARHTLFVPRALAEQDPSYKQIIPYVLFKRGNTLLHYVRGKASGEKRLVARGSLGVGGHINDQDESLFGSGLDFYNTAVEREVNEELKVEGVLRTEVVALINDDSTPVGQVHLGVVHLCEVTDQEVGKREAQITELTFLTLPELLDRRGEMETWSQLCLDFIAPRLA